MTDRTVDSIVPSASKVTVDGPEGSSDAVLTVSDPRLVRRAAALPRGPFRQEVNVAFRAITNLQALERRLQMTKTLYASLSANQLCADWGLFSEGAGGRDLHAMRVPKHRLDDTEEHRACSTAIATIDASLDMIRDSYFVLSSTVSRHNQHKDSMSSTESAMFSNAHEGRLDGDVPFTRKKPKLSFATASPSPTQNKASAPEEDSENKTSAADEDTESPSPKSC